VYYNRGEEFRRAFKNLAEIVCIFPQPEAVYLSLTATATPAAIRDLVRDLQFSHVRTVTVNPDRPNIYIEVKMLIFAFTVV
jgi:superfamily II DNA helicase RecQ